MRRKHEKLHSAAIAAAQIVMKYSVNFRYNSSKAIPDINNKHTHLLVADVQMSVISFTQVGISFFQVHDIVVSSIFVSYGYFLSNFLLSHYYPCFLATKILVDVCCKW